jgi:hypothetical protein
MFIHVLPELGILSGMKASLRSESDHYGPTGLATIPSQAGETTLCRHCATPAPAQRVRIAGAWSVIDGVARWDCDSCARARLEEIEAGDDVRRHPSP